MIKSIDLLMRFVQKFYDVLLDVYDFLKSCRKAVLIRKYNKNRKAIRAMARMRYKLTVRQRILETECDVISEKLKKK